MKLNVLFLSGALAGLSSAFPMANMSFRPIGPIGYGGIGTSDEGHTPPLPAALTTDEFFSYKHAANEYIKLNNWIMDNRSGYRPEKEGRKCVVQGNYFRYSILKDANLSTTIYEAAHSMVYMVRNQTFENGNHRTAILLLLDYLNSIGATYTADPLALYLELADPLRLSRAEAALFIDQLAATIEKSVTIIEKPVTDTEEPPATDIEGPASVSSRETDPTDRKTKKKEKKKKKKKPKTPKQPNVPSPNQSEFRKACALRVKFANKYWFAAKDNEARVRAAQRDYDNNKNRVGKSAADIQKLYDVLVAAKQNMKEEAAYWQVEPKGGWMNFKGGLGNQRGEDGEL